MAKLKPWCKVVTPREVREGKPLDASEFAVHLHQFGWSIQPGDLEWADGWSTGRRKQSGPM